MSSRKQSDMKNCLKERKRILKKVKKKVKYTKVTHAELFRIKLIDFRNI